MNLADYLVRYFSKRLVRLALIGLCLCWIEGYSQQETLRQRADRLFHTQAYSEAIQIYSGLLENQAPAKEVSQGILYNLGYAYMQVGDFRRAEERFQQYLAQGDPAGNQRQLYLYYAQTLAQNGKFQEAQTMYERYEAVKETISPDYRRFGPGTAGADSAKVTYRVETLSINTDKAEFSPAFFREGLVYVSGKGSSQATASTNKGFLDLYYVPERTDIAAAGIVDSNNKVIPLTKNRAAKESTQGRRLGKDTYTRPTANDSRTVLSYSPYGFSEGLGLGKGASKGAGMQGFSKELNTKYHEGPVTFSADGSTIIFTRNNFNEGKSSKSKDNVNKLKLYTADLTDGGWTNVRELPFNSDEYSSGHPTLSRDGKILYFVSDRPGGKGGTDLYMSQLKDGVWSQPVNMGGGINTKGDEMFPFVDENGNLYFSSNGHPKRLGGLDIYFVPLSGNGNQSPVISHLDAPINSKGDDFGLITDGNRTFGYFSSNRLEGNDDIFRFFRESSLFGCRNLTLRVAEEGTTTALEGVEVIVKARGEGRGEQKLYTNADGLVNICLEANNDFLFELAKDGYISGALGFSTVGLTDDRSISLGASLLKPEFRDVDTIQHGDSQPLARLSTGSTDWEDEATLTRSTLRGTVTGEMDKTPLADVKIILRNECDGTVKQTVTGPDGRYQFDLVEGCDYTLVATKTSYGTNTSAIKKIPVKSKPKVVSANLKMLKTGDMLTLDNIHYDSGKWDIRKDAARELDKMVATMLKYPSLKIEIGSHTDSQGNAEFNQYLSERRAKAALNYLASKGISRSRMVAKGYGESQLLNQCKDGVLCTEEEHQRNRRTEFRILFIR